jgi:hypothetical protein
MRRAVRTCNSSTRTVFSVNSSPVSARRRGPREDPERHRHQQQAVVQRHDDVEQRKPHIGTIAQHRAVAGAVPWLACTWADRRQPPHQCARDPQIDPDLHCTLVAPDPTAAALACIARESIKLLTGSDFPRVRACAGCSLLFVGRSRPGLRRWCSMDRWGNRDKTTRYREKRQHA